jgi:acyl-CoA synthetase (AMP-forming)/AMP-acid ligase II
VTLLHHGLEAAASRFGARAFIRAGDVTLSFADVDGLSNALARDLSCRVGRGDRVAVMSTNRPEFVIAVHAISKLGAASILLSPAWKAVEVDHAIALTKPCHAVADGPAVALLAERVAVTDLDDPRPSTDRSPVRPTASAPDDESVLVFSSGTTGLPKAVRHTHASIARATDHWRAVLGLGPDDRFQVATPPSHILGLLNLLVAATVGVTIRLHRRFDLDEVLGCIQGERMTLEMAVAPIALAMANHPRLEDYDLSSLRYIMWGATPVTPHVAARVTERTGVRWLPAYGASELPVIACNPLAHPRLDSAGLAAREVRLRVVDLDTGAVLGPGEIGEIQARSPSLMAGYLPEDANADGVVDGWYRTGDVGWLEADGWVHLTDRSKEMIKVNGFQVAPAEIEAVLLGHPSVLDCAVFGIPDDRTGEAPVAAVQLQGACPVKELEQLVADSLATYKRVRDVVVVDTIPRLPSGKALRRTLRDQWISKNGER